MLQTENTTLLVIDVQGKLAHSMHAKQALFENIKRIIRGAQILDVAILWTEQYPDGLGPTIPEIADLLAGLKPISKFNFSCCDNDLFIQRLEGLHPENILLAGIEAHICVYQTARDLVRSGYRVEIIEDAVSSRTIENKRIGLEKCKQTGTAVTGTETVLFELLKTAKDARFKDILNIVK